MNGNINIPAVNRNSLYAEMKEHGHTQDTLAKALGISSNAFWRKANGYNDFTLPEIVAIERELKLSVERSRDIFFNHELEYTQTNGL